MRVGREVDAAGRPPPEGTDSGDAVAREAGWRARKRVRTGWWIVSGAALGAALIAMHVYQKSMEEDFERMLRAALQQHLADNENPEQGARGEKP